MTLVKHVLPQAKGGHMKKRILGTIGPEVSALGLGSMRLCHGGTADVKLTSDDLASTEKILAAVGEQGDRYPAYLAARVGR